MKEIKLTNSDLATIVDDEDFERVNRYEWFGHRTGNTTNSIRPTRNIGNKIIRMYRVILNAKKGEIIDHINGDPLDNRKQNLRICTKSQNCMNSKMRSNNTSGFKGVNKGNRRTTWRAEIWLNNKKINLGCFKNIYDAVFARKEGEVKYHGEFAGAI